MIDNHANGFVGARDLLDVQVDLLDTVDPVEPVEVLLQSGSEIGIVDETLQKPPHPCSISSVTLIHDGSSFIRCG